MRTLTVLRRQRDMICIERPLPSGARASNGEKKTGELEALRSKVSSLESLFQRVIELESKLYVSRVVDKSMESIGLHPTAEKKKKE